MDFPHKPLVLWLCSSFDQVLWSVPLLSRCHERWGTKTIKSFAMSQMPDVRHNDVIKWKHLPRYWLLMRGIWCIPLTQRPVTWSFDGFLYLRLNNWLSNQSKHRWFEKPSRLLWRHCNGIRRASGYNGWKDVPWRRAAGWAQSFGQMTPWPEIMKSLVATTSVFNHNWGDYR